VGDDRTILAARERVYQAAKTRHPERWTGSTRTWAPIGAVWLNPVKEPPCDTDLLLKTT
jgi:putative transposase